MRKQRERIAADDLANEATILFEHHPELLLAFNAFLPESEKVAVDMFLQPFEEECLEYITKLKNLPPHVQKSFFKIMNEYGQGRMSLHDLKRMVFALPFKDRKLLSEFDTLISCEGDQNEENLPLKAPTRKVKRTKCNFPELVFNKEISFFEKAKAKMQQKKKSLNALLTCFDKYRQGRVVSCEFQEEEKRTRYESNLAREVLNDYCSLFNYDAHTQFLEQMESKKGKRSRETQEHSRDQELEQKSKQDIISSQDEYVAETHRNKRTLKAIDKLERRVEKGSNVDFDTLLKGFCFTSVKKCCGEDEIRMLKREDAMVLSSIKEKIERRQRFLESVLKTIDERKKQEWEKGSQGGKRARKQVVK